MPATFSRYKHHTAVPQLNPWGSGGSQEMSAGRCVRPRSTRKTTENDRNHRALIRPGQNAIATV